MSEQIKALWKRIFDEGANHGKFEVIDELLATNVVFNNPVLPGGKLTGSEAYKKYIQAHRAAYPDLHITITDQIADGDRVVSRWSVTGTHEGPEIGIPPTGKHVTVTGITIANYRSGKFVELWEISDALGLLQQLGVVPTPEPASTSS
jgi:steroid delta-isomerase-like uncharacterized protein